MGWGIIGLLVVGAPSVLSLEVDEAIPDDLQFQLVDRLLERGHRVFVEPTESRVRVAVERDGDRYLAQVATSTNTLIVVPTEPQRLRELELVQKVAVAVESARGPVARGAVDPAVVVPSARSLSAQLRRELIVELRRAGLGLTERPLPGDVLLCIQAIGSDLGAGTSRSPDPCVADERVAADAFGRRAVAMAHATLEPESATGVAVEMDSASAERSRFGLGAYAGAIGRTELGADAAFGLITHLGPGAGLGGNLGFDVAPAPQGDVSVWELGLAVGPEWGVGLGKRTRISAALRLGANFHIFDVVDGDSGTEVDFLGQVPLEVSWRVFSTSRIGVLAMPALVSRSRRHLRGDEVLWEAGLFRFTVALALSHDLFL